MYNNHPDTYYSTNPFREDACKEAHWQDHWQQAVYPLGHHVEVKEGETWTLRASHADAELWFDILSSAAEPTAAAPASSAEGVDLLPPTKKARVNDVVIPPHCSCGVHSL